jgi:hypothetical protein
MGARLEAGVTVRLVAGELREGWYNDPTGRHAERWYVGGRLTSRVRDGVAESQDPVEVPGRWSDQPVSALEGWCTDPLRRHEQRWFSAGMPTGLVRDGETQGHDPVDLAQLGDASFGGAEPVSWLPEPSRSGPDGQGPVAWWDGWVAAPGEPRLECGLDGATGLGIQAGMRTVMRWSWGKSLLAIDIRFFWFAVVTIGFGVASLYLFGAATGVALIAVGLVVLVGAVLFAISDFAEETPARRFQKRVSRRGQPRAGGRPGDR